MHRHPGAAPGKAAQQAPTRVSTFGSTQPNKPHPNPRAVEFKHINMSAAMNVPSKPNRKS